MLDVLACLLLSAGILIGTTYLPAPSEVATAQPAVARTAAVLPQACPAKPIAASNARVPACRG